PISPILFLLYMEPIAKLPRAQRRFCYADDLLSLYTGMTVDEVIEKVFEDYDILLGMGQSLGSLFNPKKTEIQLFSRRRTAPVPPTVTLKDKEYDPNGPTRWLGVWLDKKLTFTAHTHKWATKLRAWATISEASGTHKGGPLQGVCGTWCKHASSRSLPTGPKYGTKVPKGKDIRSALRPWKRQWLTEPGQPSP